MIGVADDLKGQVPLGFVCLKVGVDRDSDQIVKELVKLVRDLGSVPVAEGIEMQAEADVCRDIGFELIQGYLTGKPIPADQI